MHHAKGQLDDSQAGIKIARRNINNLRYAGNTILMAEIEEDVFPLLHILASFVEDKVPKSAWVYLWAFYFITLIFAIQELVCLSICLCHL